MCVDMTQQVGNLKAQITNAESAKERHAGELAAVRTAAENAAAAVQREHTLELSHLKDRNAEDMRRLKQELRAAQDLLRRKEAEVRRVDVDAKRQIDAMTAAKEEEAHTVVEEASMYVNAGCSCLLLRAFVTIFPLVPHPQVQVQVGASGHCGDGSGEPDYIPKERARGGGVVAQVKGRQGKTRGGPGHGSSGGAHAATPHGDVQQGIGGYAPAARCRDGQLGGRNGGRCDALPRSGRLAA